ncbi:MAG: FHA domain-containing protein, partial [Patescibacteria group bacterium]|nr:FHA domain-containing protein [Patescibacteria group bacterium]
KHPGQAIPVRGPKFFIGRSEDCQLRPGSPEVSRHHAVLLVEDGFLAVRDFGSRNGTFVNEEPVQGERELKSGDHVRIGPLEFEVQLTVAVGGKKKPKVASIREAAARTAAPAAETGEVDISAWFDDEAAAPPSGSETQIGVPAEIAAVIAKDKGAAKDKEAARDKGAEEQPQAEKKKFSMAPAPTFSKPKSASSDGAAADVLRKLMGH